MLEVDEVQVREDLTMSVRPVRVLEMVCDETTQEMTWEMENLMRKSYPHLFPGKFYFRGRKFFLGGGI